MKKPEMPEDVAAQDQPVRPRKARKQGPDKWHIFRETDDESEPLEFVTSIHGDRDPATYIERSEEFDAAAYLCRKTKANGQILESYSHVKTERPETTINLDEGDDADALEFEPPQAAGVVDVRAIAQAFDALLDKRDRRERAAQAQPSFIELQREADERLERHLERERKRDEAFQARIDAALSRANSASAPTNPAEPIKQALGLLRDVTGLQSEMGAVASGEPPGIGDRLFGLLEKTVDAVSPYAGPVIGGLIQKATQAQAAVAAQQTAHPQADAVAPGQSSPGVAQPPPPPSEPTAEQALLNALNVVVTGLRRGKRPGASADAIDELLTKHPEFRPQIDQLLATPPVLVLSELSRVSGEDLSVYVGALEFIAALKDELRPDDGEESEAAEIAPVSPSRNGDGAEVGVVI
jgi:hypothetical protein